jgi:PilZ domain
MLKTIRTNFDRREMRRDRRYPAPRITVTLGDSIFEVLDWSLGGFQTVEGPAVAIGEQVAGTIQIEGYQATYDFAAEAVRSIEANHGVGFHFIELSPELVTALDRAALRRFVGRR